MDGRTYKTAVEASLTDLSEGERQRRTFKSWHPFPWRKWTTILPPQAWKADLNASISVEVSNWFMYVDQTHVDILQPCAAGRFQAEK
jgi:hypothetical protein